VEVNIENLLSTHQWGVAHCNDDGMKLFQHSDSCLYI
jgi:hypothetical protein